MEPLIATRLLTPCCTFGEHDVIDVDVSSILRSLILFDSVILESAALKEFPRLLEAFGVEGVEALLRSDRLKVKCQLETIGQSEQALKNTYEFRRIFPANREQFLDLRLQGLNRATEGRLDRRGTLVEALLESLVKWPEVSKAVPRFVQQLRTNDPMIGTMLHYTLKKQQGLLNLCSLTVRLEEVGDARFQAVSNLASFGLDANIEHQVIERALLGLAGIEQRIEDMEVHEALSGFLDAECPLFTAKLGFLLKKMLPQPMAESFERVVEIAEMPEFIPSLDRIDANRLLEVLDTKECKEFRHWLQTISSATDLEISDRVRSLRARLGGLANSSLGRVVRFLVPKGLTLLNPAVGLGAAAANSFLVDRLLPSSGIWTFANKLYPSIFRQLDTPTTTALAPPPQLA